MRRKRLVLSTVGFQLQVGIKGRRRREIDGICEIYLLYNLATTAALFYRQIGITRQMDFSPIIRAKPITSEETINQRTGK